jgi:hypothetical protein
MKVYLLLDLPVNDFGGFRKYIAEIPAFIAKRSGSNQTLHQRPPGIRSPKTDWAIIA